MEGLLNCVSLSKIKQALLLKYMLFLGNGGSSLYKASNRLALFKVLSLTTNSLGAFVVVMCLVSVHLVSSFHCITLWNQNLSLSNFIDVVKKGHHKLLSAKFAIGRNFLSGFLFPFHYCACCCSFFSFGSDHEDLPAASIAYKEVNPSIIWKHVVRINFILVVNVFLFNSDQERIAGAKLLASLMASEEAVLQKISGGLVEART